MPSHHKNKGAVNAYAGAQSTLNLDIQNLNLTNHTKVKDGTVKDDYGGVWSAVRSKTPPLAHDVRLILKTVPPPENRKKGKDPAPPKKDKLGDPPTGGQLTITLTLANDTDPKTITEDVEYVNDPPPP